MKIGPYRPPHAAESRFTEFQASIEQQRQAGPDAFGYAHDNAFADYLTGSQALRSVVSEFINGFDTLSPTNAAQRIPKSSQAMEMQYGAPDFPRGYERPEAWKPVFDRLVDDSAYRTEHLLNLTMPIASNVSERGKLLKAVSLLHGYSGPVRIMDMGCSLNHNLKRLARYGEPGLDYVPTDVVRQRGARVAKTLRGTAALTRLIHQESLVIGPSVGVDLFSAKDESFRTWAKSNSFYMSELLDPARTAQFDRLSEDVPGLVGFRWADVGTRSEDKFGSPEFDVVYLSTMLYQLPPEQVRIALENAHGSVKPDGLIVVQDFAEFQPDGTPTFYDKWQWPWHYNVWVKDMRQPEAGFQKYFTADGGRAKQVMVHPAVGRLAAAQEIGLVPTVEP